MAPQNFSDFVVDSPFMSYCSGMPGAVVHLQTANDIAIYAFTMPYPQKVTNICVNIITGDNSNNSDIGIYDADGNRLGHIGAQHISSGVQSFPISGGPIIIGPGLYFLAFTSAAAVLEWSVGASSAVNQMLGLQSAGSTSTGGSLPSPITINDSLDPGHGSPYQSAPPVMILT